MQGLVDSHIHMMAGGLTLQRVDLRGTDSKAKLIAAVKSAAGEFMHTSWLKCTLQMRYKKVSLWHLLNACTILDDYPPCALAQRILFWLLVILHVQFLSQKPTHFSIDT